VEVSRSQIAANYRAVRNAAGAGVETVGVVKADAYGHGMIEVARVLAAEGAKWLAVSSVEEGVSLRRSGIELGVLVMAGVLPTERETVVEHGLTPAVHSLTELPELEAAAAREAVHESRAPRMHRARLPRCGRTFDGGTGTIPSGRRKSSHTQGEWK